MSVVLGLEHEYLVHDRGRPLDFREELHARRIPGRRLDPSDPNAYRLPTGLKLTCDGREAEIASPPVPAGPGFTARLDAWAEEGAATLAALFPSFSFTGESTHLSVSVADDHAVEVAALFARAFGPALMLLMDDTESPGLLVRPRSGRVELGGEFVAGRALASAAALALGGVRLCSRVVEGSRHRRDLPRPVRMTIEPAVDRWGWYLDRRAFGRDLVGDGRAATLRRERRGTVSGQDLLEHAWKAAREVIESDVEPCDLESADDVVFGLDPLPGETAVDRSPPASGRMGRTPATPAGRAVATRTRGSIRVRPHVLDWQFAVFAVESVASRAFVSVPDAALATFLEAIDRGELDRELPARLEVASARLSTREQALGGGWYRGVVPGPALGPPERDVTGKLRAPVIPLGPSVPAGVAGGAAEALVAGGGAGTESRFGKDLGMRPQPSPSPWRRWWKAGAVGAALVAAAATFFLTTNGDDQPDAGAPTPSAPIDEAVDLVPTPAPSVAVSEEPDVTPPGSVTVADGISPDRLGLFEFGPDGLIRFAYEGDEIVGRIVVPSRQSLTLNLWGFTGQCWALGEQPSQRVVDGEIVAEHEFVEGDRVFTLDESGSGTWITFDRVPAPDIGGGVFRCIPNTGDPVDVVFGDRQADALGEQDGEPYGFSFARVSE